MFQKVIQTQMGIKSNFNKLLKEQCTELFETVHISEYRYKRIAIDISLYMHKFKAIRGSEWLQLFVDMIATLRRNDIHCVFIFDGKSPVEKEEERSKRKDDRDKNKNRLESLSTALDEYYRTGEIAQCLTELYNNRRQKDAPPKRLLSKSTRIDMKWVEYKVGCLQKQVYEISSKDFERAKELFNILNVPYYTAPWEAEKTCAKLCIDGRVDAVLSEDTDVIAYGCPVFLSKIDMMKETVVRVKYDSCLEQMNLEHEQFLDLCIMCGTDYNPNIPRVGSKTAYKLLLEHNSIEAVAENTELNTSILKHVRSRELFRHFEDDDIGNVPFCGTPDFKKLTMFITKCNIRRSVDALVSDFTEVEITFE